MSMPSSPSFSDFSCSGEPDGDWLNVAIITFQRHACGCCLSTWYLGAAEALGPECPLSRNRRVALPSGCLAFGACADCMLAQCKAQSAGSLDGAR